MNVKKAEENLRLLAQEVSPQKVYNIQSPRVDWGGGGKVFLDGCFTIEQLESLAVWIRKNQK